MIVSLSSGFAGVTPDSAQLLRHLRDLHADPGYPTEIVWHPMAPILSGRSHWGEWHWWHVNGRLVRRFAAPALPATLWSSDGRWCLLQRRPSGAASACSGQIVVWHAAGQIALSSTLAAGRSWRGSCAWHPRRPMLAFIRSAHSFALWNAETGALRVINHRADQLGWLPDGRGLWTSSGAVLKVWTLDGEVEAVVARPGRAFSMVLWNPAGTLLLEGAPQGLRDGLQICAYTLRSLAGRQLITVEAPIWHFHARQAAMWRPDGACLALAVDRQIQLIDPDGAVTAVLDGHHGAAITALAWHPQGTLLASGAWDSTLHLWDAAGALIHILPTYRLLRSPIGVTAALAWHCHGQFLAASLRSTLISLWAIPREPVYALTAPRPTRMATLR